MCNEYGNSSVLTEEDEVLVNRHKLVDKMQDKGNYVNMPGAYKSNLSMLFCETVTGNISRVGPWSSITIYTNPNMLSWDLF